MKISMLNAMERAKSFSRGWMRRSRKVHVEEAFSSVVVNAPARDERAGCDDKCVTSLQPSVESSFAMDSTSDIESPTRTKSDLSNRVSRRIRSHTTLALPGELSLLDDILGSAPMLPLPDSSSLSDDESSEYAISVSSLMSTAYDEGEEWCSSSDDEEVWEA
eukprot:TRINITY_DN8065_c0_g1_i1.p1 TRINITY_DN8065_c0_g1~~TRINITY_DN8065_c0_g1_i1.p1  ORF type:complete len:162 (-),score=28.94 TRINITY_DN8065_c0_g1_i1:116-601(-)